MSFLPFVLSFLLILVLGSSVVFNSFRSTSLEKTVILGIHNAKLELISQQADIEFKQIEKAKIGPPKEPKTRNKTSGQNGYPDRRNQRDNLQTSKLNLWPLFNSKDVALTNTVYDIAARLIHLLYKDADFYKAAQNENLAERILDEMMKQKGETFYERFPKNSQLASIYYQMLKGTNTSYPALEEYFRLEKTNPPEPIIWPYASATVLRATLGEEATQQVLSAEKANWESNHYKRVLTEENLRALLKDMHTDLDINHLKAVFCFQKVKKGLPCAHVEAKNKLMAKNTR